jgi:hypothetical protein
MANPLITMTTTMGMMGDQLRLYTKLQNFFAIGGITGEPMSSICNRVMGRLFSRRMPWRFNQCDLAPFPYGPGNFMVSQPGFQQIQFAGASVFVLLPQSTQSVVNMPYGGVGVDLAPKKVGNFIYGPQGGGSSSVYIDPTTGIITVQTLDPHPFQSQNVSGPAAYLTGLTNPAFNAVYTYNGLLSQAAWTQGLNILSIVDATHFTLQGVLGNHYGSLTHISATAGTTTVTVANTMSVGDIMTFSNIVTNTALNGLQVTLTVVTATTVSFATPSGVTITNGADTGYIYAAPSGAPGIYDFSWLQAADIYDLNSQSFPMPLDQIQAVHRKSKEYSPTGDNLEIACQKDNNNGVLVFRLTEPQGNYPFAFSLTYQKRAPKMTDPGNVFPWPDELSFVLFEMCMYEACRIAYGISGEETQLQAQAAAIALENALSSEDRESNTMGLTPDFSLMTGPGM